MKKMSLLLLWTLFLAQITAQELKPTDKLALLKGKVTNFKGKVLSNEVVMLVDEKKQESFKITTDPQGKFELLVPVNTTYTLKYKKFTTDVNYTKMNIPADKEAEYEVLIKIDPPKEFVLENVYFDSGKSIIKAESNTALNNLVEVLKAKSSMQVEIQGHTDNVGQEEDNLKLSQGRAEAVKKYLITKGIAENRIQAKGYGSEQPIADNSTAEGKAKNRRTSLKVLKE